jgi:hypothetical protein
MTATGRIFILKIIETSSGEIGVPKAKWLWKTIFYDGKYFIIELKKLLLHRLFSIGGRDVEC